MSRATAQDGMATFGIFAVPAWVAEGSRARKSWQDQLLRVAAARDQGGRCRGDGPVTHQQAGGGCRIQSSVVQRLMHGWEGIKGWREPADRIPRLSSASQPMLLNVRPITNVRGKTDKICLSEKLPDLGSLTPLDTMESGQNAAARPSGSRQPAPPGHLLAPPSLSALTTLPW